MLGYIDIVSGAVALSLGYTQLKRGQQMVINDCHGQRQMVINQRLPG